MDIQTFLGNGARMVREAEWAGLQKGAGVTFQTLGSLVDQLKICGQDKPVHFDNVGGHPHSVASYRGYYEFLAIAADDKLTTVADLVVMLNGAIDETFTGYKGGEFLMTEETTIFVSEYGECSGLIVRGLKEDATKVTLLTYNEH